MKNDKNNQNTDLDLLSVIDAYKQAPLAKK